MKIDCSKISNKDDLVTLICICFLFVILCFVGYLAMTQDTFWAGFTAGTVTWKWKAWFYDPVDRFLEKKWPT